MTRDLTSPTWRLAATGLARLTHYEAAANAALNRAGALRLMGWRCDLLSAAGV